MQTMPHWWYNSIVTHQGNKMSRNYGIPSRRMLKFLYRNPGATSADINRHLFDNRELDEIQISWRYNSEAFEHRRFSVNKTWVPAAIVKAYFTSSFYKDVQIVGTRKRKLSEVSRGKFAYLLSPYGSRTLASDSTGRRPHPHAANPDYQRCWFWRTRVDGRYRYFLTLKGMAALNQYGLD